MGALAIMDISVDAFVLTNLDEDYYSLGASMCYIGQISGMFFSFILFIQLNSVDFCNQFIWSTPQDEPLMMSSHLLIILSVF